MQTALLRVDQAKAQLTAAKLAFLPSLTLSPQGTLTSTAGSKTVKTYELPVQASWEIDLFGNLRNAKKGTQATLLQQQAYQQAVRSELIAGIANTYYSLLMLDEQVAISQSTLEVWKEQVRTMEARMKVGEETENAVTQARASLYELEATHNDLLRQQRETENSLCTLLGMTSRSLERGTLDKQIFPETLPTGIPVRLLSRRPDIVQAEMTLANAYYTTNQARSAFYPNLSRLDQCPRTGSHQSGGLDSLGSRLTDPTAFQPRKTDFQPARIERRRTDCIAELQTGIAGCRTGSERCPLCHRIGRKESGKSPEAMPGTGTYGTDIRSPVPNRQRHLPGTAYRPSIATECPAECSNRQFHTVPGGHQSVSGTGRRSRIVHTDADRKIQINAI